jgi:hypothetical protein
MSRLEIVATMEAPVTSVPFERVAAFCAMINAMTGFLYALALTAVSAAAPEAGAFLGAVFLMLGGLLTAVVQIALYNRLRRVDDPWALLALLFGFAGAIGATMHAGYDLANAVHAPSAGAQALAGLPSQVDPRGLLTFGIGGASLLIIAWLMGQDPLFPRGLGTLGFVLAVLLIVLYLGRLIILFPAHPVILVVTLLTGFLVGPAWYGWLGIVLRAASPLPEARRGSH